MTIYEKIDSILAQKKMSRRKLAQKAGILVGTLSTAYSRQTNLKYETLVKIATALDMDLFDLVRGTDLAVSIVSQMVSKALETAEREETRLEEAMKAVMNNTAELREVIKSAIDNVRDDDLDTVARVLAGIIYSGDTYPRDDDSSDYNKTASALIARSRAYREILETNLGLAPAPKDKGDSAHGEA